jgi:hypothetical protein
MHHAHVRTHAHTSLVHAERVKGAARTCTRRCARLLAATLSMCVVACAHMHTHLSHRLQRLWRMLRAALCTLPHALALASLLPSCTHVRMQLCLRPPRTHAHSHAPDTCTHALARTFLLPPSAGTHDLDLPRLVPVGRLRQCVVLAQCWLRCLCSPMHVYSPSASLQLFCTTVRTQFARRRTRQALIGVHHRRRRDMYYLQAFEMCAPPRPRAHQLCP